RWVVTAWAGDQLIGFARAISDGVRNGYISTVVVDAEYRGRGVGRQLVERLTAGRERVRWVLHTRPETKGFYAKLGFEPAPARLWRDRRCSGTAGRTVCRPRWSRDASPPSLARRMPAGDRRRLRRVGRRPARRRPRRADQRPIGPRATCSGSRGRR